MTIREFVKKRNIIRECAVNGCRSMDVQVVFINDENCDDETEFTINAYDWDELAKLYSDFCKENGFPKNTVENIIIAKAYTVKAECAGEEYVCLDNDGLHH